MDRKIAAMPIILGLIMVIVVSGCTTQPPGNGDNGTDDPIILSDGMVLDENFCIEKVIKDKVIVMHRHGCPACGIAVPLSRIPGAAA